ncbi:hypothetical protein [Halomonas korlensis]|uniref:Uncharacterized protein n=1 Tax=Halomonas korlensis TaxID=463301 RepID=A0A1I7FFY0_9GAMM|nr:hypothetical protein [Halomonas korlensis]SFU35025.1 hypothetical protein SAMN04487955_101455 [Halomonas korlensis]
MSRGDISSSRTAGQDLPRAWGRWGLSLLVVLGLMLLLGMGQRLLEQRTDDPLYRVIVNGQPLTLDAKTHAALDRDMQEVTEDIEARLMARMRPWIRMRLAITFAPLEAAVPGYLDWYFSLSGSYARLGMTLVDDVEPWLEAQLHERLVTPSGIEQALAELQRAYPKQLAGMQQRLVDQLTQQLYERYAPRQVSMQEDARPATAVYVLDLDEVLNRSLSEEMDMTRWRAATAGGASLGMLTGRALARRLGAAVVMQGGRMAMRGLLARLGVSTARSLTSGGVVAAATAPSGPGALLAGAATTAVTLAGFAGSEYALLKLQEARHRPAMQAHLLDEIDRAHQALIETFEARTMASAMAAGDRLAGRFSPADRRDELPHAYRILDRRGE